MQEIELVISRLEEETTTSQDELERAADARVRRVREKYETELREVEWSERSTLDKFNNLRVCDSGCVHIIMYVSPLNVCVCACTLNIIYNYWYSDGTSE